MNELRPEKNSNEVPGFQTCSLHPNIVTQLGIVRDQNAKILSTLEEIKFALVGDLRIKGLITRVEQLEIKNEA